MNPNQPNWFAVVTKPRQETIALENLQRQAFKCFLPMAENPYQRKNKNHAPIVEPLFPRYLFIRANAKQQNLAPVRSTRGVISMVRFGLELAIVPDRIINAIKARMSPTTGLINIKPIDVKPGDKIRVFDGPLAGINGIVQEKNSANRALILLELMGRQTTVEIDPMLLQRTG